MQSPHSVAIAWANPFLRSHQPSRDIGTELVQSRFSVMGRKKGFVKRKQSAKPILIPSTPRPRTNPRHFVRPDITQCETPAAQPDVPTPVCVRDFDYKLSDEQRRTCIAVYFVDRLGAPVEADWDGFDGAISTRLSSGAWVSQPLRSYWRRPVRTWPRSSPTQPARCLGRFLWTESSITKRLRIRTSRSTVTSGRRSSLRQPFFVAKCASPR